MFYGHYASNFLSIDKLIYLYYWFNVVVIYVAISALFGTRPEQTSVSSITSPGVVRMGYSIIFLISLTCSTDASIASSLTTSRAVFSIRSHLAQPIPSTFIIIPTSFGDYWVTNPKI